MNFIIHFFFLGTMMSPQKNLGNQTVFKRGYYVGKIAMAIKKGENAEQYSKLFSQPINAVFRIYLKEKKVIAYYLLCELVKLFDQVLLEFVQNISKREKIKLYTQI